MSEQSTIPFSRPHEDPEFVRLAQEAADRMMEQAAERAVRELRPVTEGLIHLRHWTPEGREQLARILRRTIEAHR